MIVFGVDWYSPTPASSNYTYRSCTYIITTDLHLIECLLAFPLSEFAA